ncbi:MAG: 50S ribosomal protein L11 methyltransferase [Ferruginibacter sp.]
MKLFIRQFAYFILQPLLSIKYFRNFIRHLGNASGYYQQARICKAISPEKEVLAGPFKGLVYSRFEAAGSVLIPKIMGTYEDELHPTLEKIIKKNYTEIIDVGCAEGYYSNGLALKIPAATVFAYDLDPHARELCKGNATVNNLQLQVRINSFIDAGSLASFPFSGKGFIMCDCEGFEIELFTPASVKNLLNCDLIIELHDCNNEAISATILPLFENSHQLTLIKSNPGKKIADYPYLGKNSNLTDDLLNERNGIIMYWAFLEAI